MPDKTVSNSSGANSNNNYGAVHAETNRIPSIMSPRRVIYCVHGKPSDGCCKVLEGEVIDLEPRTEDFATITKENIDTTDLGTY